MKRNISKNHVKIKSIDINFSLILEFFFTLLNCDCSCTKILQNHVMECSFVHEWTQYRHINRLLYPFKKKIIFNVSLHCYTIAREAIGCSLNFAWKFLFEHWQIGNCIYNLHASVVYEKTKFDESTRSFALCEIRWSVNRWIGILLPSINYFFERWWWARRCTHTRFCWFGCIYLSRFLLERKMHRFVVKCERVALFTSICLFHYP